MGGVRLTRREALGVAGAGAVSLALPGSPLGAAPLARGGLRPELVTVTLRLNGSARAVLRRGRPLRVTLRVSQAGARSRSATVRLRRSRR